MLTLAVHGARPTVAAPQRSHATRNAQRVHPPLRRAVLAGSAGTASIRASTGSRELVDELVRILDGSDCGANLKPDEKDRVEALIGQLEQFGAEQAPLDDPAIFGTYNVAYSAASKKCAHH